MNTASKKANKPTAMNFLGSLTSEERPVVRLALDVVQPDPNQPRQTWHGQDGYIPPEAQTELENLAQSIRDQDVIQPIIVREVGPNSYMIVAGERRWRAARLAGKSDIPAIVRQDMSALDVEMAQLAENVQRESMSDLDTAKFVKSMLEKYPNELQKKDLAKLLNKHASYVSRMMAFVDERWSHIVDTGLITYASVLEQFRGLSTESQAALLDKAKARGTPVTAADVHGAKKEERKESNSAGSGGDLEKTSSENAGRDDEPGDNDQQQAGGAQDDLGKSVQNILESQRVEGEKYQYKPGTDHSEGETTRQHLNDAGAEVVNGLPTDPREVVKRDRFSETQEVKLSLGQLAKLLDTVAVNDNASLTISLDVELMRSAIESLGGKVPDDANWMQMALVESLK
ncbi:MAG: ParB/RepB/Spo0J family partition protein [Candidatus Paceibacterota bacterium]